MWKKIRLIWHVLLGKPLIYRIHFPSGIVLDKVQKDVWLVENLISNSDIGITLTDKREQKDNA